MPRTGYSSAFLIVMLVGGAMPSLRATQATIDAHPAGTSTAQARDSHTSAVARVRFYEGNDATQENICTYDITSAPYYLKSTSSAETKCEDDEARSMKLENMPPGSVIEVYDKKTCDDSDDWARITVKKQSSQIIVPTFNRNKDLLELAFTQLHEALGLDNPNAKEDGGLFDPRFSQVYREYNKGEKGVDGKISCIIIDVPAPH